MLAFDQAYSYQFVVFTEEQTGASGDAAVRVLPEIASRPVAGTESLGLKLAQVQPESTLVVLSTGATASGWTWRSASGFWRLGWTPGRVELSFDARGHAEAREMDVVPLPDVRRRVQPNIIEMINVAGRATRLALIVSGRSSCTGLQLHPSQIVAQRFFNADLIAAAQRGELREAMGRANLATRWNLGSSGGVRVNRHEIGAVNLSIQDDAEQESLSWQLDVNTHPRGEIEYLVGSSVDAFFGCADEWIVQRLRALQEGA